MINQKRGSTDGIAAGAATIARFQNRKSRLQLERSRLESDSIELKATIFIRLFNEFKIHLLESACNVVTSLFPCPVQFQIERESMILMAAEA